jgi:predicted amidohydrolase
MSTGDRAFEPIIDACRDAGSVALVGAPVHGEHGRSHIAVVVVDGRGASVAYRKLWLGSSEARRFTPGDGPARLDVDGWRLGLAVCKDTGIAQHALDTAALGIDAYVAGTLLFPHEAAELNARAQRIATAHSVYVAMASFAGPTGDGYGESAGGSGIWTPEGVLLDQAGTGIGEFARAALS